MAFAQVQRRSRRLSDHGHEGPVEKGAEIRTKLRLELERSTTRPQRKRLLRSTTTVIPRAGRPRARIPARLCCDVDAVADFLPLACERVVSEYGRAATGRN